MKAFFVTDVTNLIVDYFNHFFILFVIQFDPRVMYNNLKICFSRKQFTLPSVFDSLNNGMLKRLPGESDI